MVLRDVSQKKEKSVHVQSGVQTALSDRCLLLCLLQLGMFSSIILRQACCTQLQRFRGGLLHRLNEEISAPFTMRTRNLRV